MLSGYAASLFYSVVHLCTQENTYVTEYRDLIPLQGPCRIGWLLQAD